MQVAAKHEVACLRPEGENKGSRSRHLYSSTFNSSVTFSSSRMSKTEPPMDGFLCAKDTIRLCPANGLIGVRGSVGRLRSSF